MARVSPHLARSRDYNGIAFLSYGFRPFFLLGSLYSAFAILAWLPVLYGELTVHSAFAPRDWHVHEMLYGFLPAIIAGFLFTAIPNWTGRLPVRGGPLLVLILVWAFGRIVVAISADLGWFAAMLIDVSFLALLAAAILREIVAGRNWRNLKVAGLVALLCAGNLGFHLEAHLQGVADHSIRSGIAVIVILISLVGGRIIPSFTHNWLARENPGRMPIPFGRFDIAVVMVGMLALLLWLVEPHDLYCGAVLGAAGVLHAVRLARWAGDRTTREPLVLILHLGYAFIPIGFLLASASAWDLVPASAGIHAWMTGAAGILTLAVMTRASLGHTGRALVASLPIQLIYAAILMAAVTRILASLIHSWNEVLLHAAAGAWVCAFLGFGLNFGPVLVRKKK